MVAHHLRYLRFEVIVAALAGRLHGTSVVGQALSRCLPRLGGHDDRADRLHVFVDGWQQGVMLCLVLRGHPLLISRVWFRRTRSFKHVDGAGHLRRVAILALRIRSRLLAFLKADLGWDKSDRARVGILLSYGPVIVGYVRSYALQNSITDCTLLRCAKLMYLDKLIHCALRVAEFVNYGLNDPV